PERLPARSDHCSRSYSANDPAQQSPAFHEVVMSAKFCGNRLRCVLLAVLVLMLLAGSVFPRQDETASRNSRPRTASYQIHKGDKVSVKFLYQPELNEPSVVVRPDGFISLQMVN